MKITVILLSVLFSINLIAQTKWMVKYDSTGNCGYADGFDNIMIPFGKYRMCHTDTFEIYAIVTTKDMKIIGMDKNENELFQVYPFDNGPDYVMDGVFRIIDDSGMGFADTTGTIVIPPIYDFAYGFEKGLAIVNIGGHEEKADPTDPACEYHVWKGGKWGVIDKKGNILLDIKYEYHRNPVSRKLELVSENDGYMVDDGQITKINLNHEKQPTTITKQRICR